MLYVAAPLLYSFLRCGEFLAPSGDKYVLTFTGDDTTPVTKVQEVAALIIRVAAIVCLQYATNRHVMDTAVLKWESRIVVQDTQYYATYLVCPEH